MISADERFMEELAARVAAKVVDALHAAPVLQPRLLSVPQAAMVLGRTEGAVRQLIVTGKLKNASPDGRVQIDSKDIDILIRNSKR
jgi:hypothetical protein